MLQDKVEFTLLQSVLEDLESVKEVKGSQFLLKLIWFRVVINFGIIYVGRDHQPPSRSQFHMVRLPRIVSIVEYLGWIR